MMVVLHGIFEKRKGKGKKEREMGVNRSNMVSRVKNGGVEPDLGDSDVYGSLGACILRFLSHIIPP